jgi:hypothetical protein
LQEQVMKATENTQQGVEVVALSVQEALGGQLVQERHPKVWTIHHPLARAV